MLGIAASGSGQLGRPLLALVLLALWAAGACAQGSDVSEGAPDRKGGGASNGGAGAVGGGAGSSGGSTAGMSGSSTGGAVGVYTGGASTGGASTGGASTGGASTGGASTGGASAGGAGGGGGSGNAGASGVGGSSGAGGAGGSSGAGGAGGSSGACPADVETSEIDLCPGLPLTFAGAPLAVTVSGATNGRSDDYSDCSGDGKDSVYRFIAPQDGTLRATLTPSGVRATLYARANACASGALIICENPGSIGTPATATFAVTRCGKYYVFADQDIGALNGTFELELRYE